MMRGLEGDVVVVIIFISTAIDNDMRRREHFKQRTVQNLDAGFHLRYVYLVMRTRYARCEDISLKIDRRPHLLFTLYVGYHFDTPSNLR